MFFSFSRLLEQIQGCERIVFAYTLVWFKSPYEKQVLFRFLTIKTIVFASIESVF